MPCDRHGSHGPSQARVLKTSSQASAIARKQAQVTRSNVENQRLMSWDRQGNQGNFMANNYVPPHIRNGGMAPPAGPPGINGYGGGGFGGGGGYGGNAGGYGRDRFPSGGRGGYGGRGGGGGGFQPRGGGWGGDREEDPFAKDEALKKETDGMFAGENTGINFEAYDDIPVEATGQDVPAAINTFDEVELGEALAANVKRCKYNKPTPVQKYSIPIGMAGRDLMACAQTGSGKTAAFCFPIINNILTRGSGPSGKNRKAYPQALILSPTRELSSQIYDEARKFTYQTGLRAVVVYGGAPVVNQVTILQPIPWQNKIQLCCCLMTLYALALDFFAAVVCAWKSAASKVVGMQAYLSNTCSLQ